MKKFLSPLLYFCVCFLHAQIPNNDFENWDNQPVPLQWETNSHPLTLPAFNPYIVVRDTDRYSGNFCANLIGNGIFHSWARTTFPISHHPLSLSLYYKLSFPPCVNDLGYFQQDTVSVLVEILQNGNRVDSGYVEFKGGSNFIWSPLNIPVSNNNTQFDSCRITITGGKIYGGCGFAAAATEFKIDHLSLANLPSCSNYGTVVAGAECWLIDTGSANLLMPCNLSLSTLGFSLGDTINFSFVPNSSCFSFCMQGTPIEITCIDTSNIQPACNISVTLQKQNPTSFIANNGMLHAVVSGGTAPFNFLWSNNVTGVDSIANLGEGNYCVTVSDANNCTATICDSLAGAHICIDTTLICPLGSLCCDAPLDQPVCGCDSVTYINPCVATYLAGVTSSYGGPCVTTAIKNISEAEKGIFVSPVPVRDKLYVTYEVYHSGKTEIKITNLLGQISNTIALGVQTSGKYRFELPVNGLAQGIYLLEVRNEWERRLKKFVIQ